MAVGTRRLTVRSVAWLTELTLMMVMPTTPARSRQSTLKPRISRPRIFIFGSVTAALFRCLYSLGFVSPGATLVVNHKKLLKIVQILRGEVAAAQPQGGTTRKLRRNTRKE